MLEPEERFFSPSGAYFGDTDRHPRVEAYFEVWDFDRLRSIRLKGTSKLFQIEQNVELEVMARFADHLSSEIRAVTVDDDGMITEVSTDPKEDGTHFVAYLPFSIVESLADCRTIQKSKLQELDRFGPCVDLSSYEDELGISHKVAFKYLVMHLSRRVQMLWYEVHILKSLPPHPNLVPFDRVVIDDVESRIIGFTTKYIPGGTLADVNIPFRFEWLQQLTQLVDFLNLDLGIMHQDIAPRNLLIDPDTDKILLFDFDFATNRPDWVEENNRDDVSGVAFTLHELITNDDQFVSIPHWERTMDMVQDISEWIPKRKLDSDVSKFRNFLNDWVATRKSEGIMERFRNVPNRIKWPEVPESALKNELVQPGKDEGEQQVWKNSAWYRRTALERGYYCVNWERPSQFQLSLNARKESSSQDKKDGV